MRILITGATGFIGRNLLASLACRHEIAAPSRAELDLTDDAAFRTYLEMRRFDAVIHAAANRFNRHSGAQPDLLRNNCRMFFNLARNALSFGRMLFLSSGAVYGRLHWKPRMPEESFDQHVPADDYAFSKYVCAKAVDAMDRVFEMRVFGVFGPHDDFRFRFLPNACCRALYAIPIVIEQNIGWDYLDVDDLCRILERFLEIEPRFRHYNICRGTSIDLKALAKSVIAISGAKVDTVVKSPGMAAEYSGDNGRMLGELPGFRFREIDDSIARLYRWYEARKAAIDPASLRVDG